MFKKLDSIDFETLKALNFEFPKWKKEFNSYFWVMEKIYNLYLDLKEYENIISESDKKVLNADINTFSNILSNIQKNNWKKPDWRLKKEKFNQSYINWLNDRKSIYEYNNNLLNSKDEDYSKKLTDLEEKKDKIIWEKNTEIEKLTWDKESLNETITSHKETIKKNESSIKELKADIADKELNKLASSFWLEESKYSSWSKWMIYFWFILLLIPTSITIIILTKNINDYVLTIPFGVLTIILWYFLYFQLKNYYINRDLETNFANRKAVANSFKWLLEMLNEEENFWDTTELKSKFFDKVSNILYSEIDTSNIKKHSDDVPISKLLDTINELIKKLK